MLKALKDFLFNRKGEPTQLEVEVKAEVPYKVETPEPAKCGCGRSPTGLCVGLHKLSETEWATHTDNSNKTVAQKPVARKPVARKPAVKKAPVTAITAAEKPKKAPAKPRAKKPKSN